MPSTHLKNALDFLAIGDANEADPVAIAKVADLMADNFTHTFLPASLGGMGLPSRNKAQLFELAKFLKGFFKRYNFQPPTEVIEAEDVLVLHLVSDGETVSGLPYNNEYIFIFRFEKEKIVSLKEFMDSKYTAEVMEKERAVATSNDV